MTQFIDRFHRLMCRRSVPAEAKHLLIAMALFMGLIMMTLHTVHAYKANQNEQLSIERQMNAVSEWQKKADRLNKETFRPVTVEQANQVQNRILQFVEVNQLSMLGATEHNDINGRLYEIDISGNWGNIIDFLRSFAFDDALTVIKSVTMDMEQGRMQAHVVYEIYTK